LTTQKATGSFGARRSRAEARDRGGTKVYRSLVSVPQAPRTAARTVTGRRRPGIRGYCNHAGLYADFHSNRHTFITNLCRADISPKTAQTLARHSDIRLTMDVYTHVDREEQIDAIRKLRAPGDDAA